MARFCSGWFACHCCSVSFVVLGFGRLNEREREREREQQTAVMLTSNEGLCELQEADERKGSIF